MRIHGGLGVSDSTEKPNIHTRLISVTHSVCLTGGVHIQSRHSATVKPALHIRFFFNAYNAAKLLIMQNNHILALLMRKCL